MARVRLDQLLVARGLVPSREIAQAMILAGDVLVQDVPVDKAGTKIPEDSAVRLRGPLPRFVGRGGEKLEGALDSFHLNVEGKVAIDIGASTGGFTDCLLQHGARAVYAVDVGYNQLDQKLRRDSRVRVMEKTHAKDLSPEMFDPRPHLAVMDVSFISLRKVLDPVMAVLEAPWELVALVKPQFELGREYVERGGVVNDVAHQRLAVQLVADYLVEKGARVLGDCPSPIRGGKKGNQEYFVYAAGSAA